MADERARLFVALDLPRSVREALISWRAPLLAACADALRPVPADALHVTLCFLGQRPVSDARAIGEAVHTATRPVEDLRLAAPLWLPRRRPHALALAVDDPSGALAQLQAMLADVLVAGGWFDTEDRRFLPHVTVARVRRSSDPRALARRGLSPPPSPIFAGDAVTLYRSHLGGGGARYEALARVALRKPG